MATSQKEHVEQLPRGVSVAVSLNRPYCGEGQQTFTAIKVVNVGFSPERAATGVSLNCSGVM